MRKLKQNSLRHIVLFFICMLAISMQSLASGTGSTAFTFNANRLNGELVVLEWKGDYSKLRVAEFELYKSNDGLDYENITRIDFNPDMPVPFYHYMDSSNAEAYYMIKAISLDGNVVLSEKQYIGPGLKLLDFNQYAVSGIKDKEKVKLEFEGLHNPSAAKVQVIDGMGKPVMIVDSLVSPDNYTIEVDLTYASLNDGDTHTLLISIDEEEPVDIPRIIFR